MSGYRGGDSCCRTPGDRAVIDPRRDRRPIGMWAGIAAIVAAIATSACCWLPLLLVVSGISAAGAASTFARARPFMLPVTFLLWGIGFLLVYVRRRRCTDDSACATTTRASVLGQVGVWASLILVLGFATLPHWLAWLHAPRSSVPNAATRDQQSLPIGRVDGMTCAACALEIEEALRRVPGVLSARVAYPSGDATAVVDPNRQPDPDALRQAAAGVGYRLDAPGGDKAPAR